MIKQALNHTYNAFDKNLALRSATRMALAGVIAFLIYRSLHWKIGYWSVVTVAAVIQSTVSVTLQKSYMRLIGTIIGVVAGYLIALIGIQNNIISLAVFILVITFTGTLSLRKGLFSYLGIISGVTCVLVMEVGLREQHLYMVVVIRTLEVMLGIGTVWVIDGIISLLFLPPEQRSTNIKAAINIIRENLPDIRLAHAWIGLRIALAAGFTYGLWLYFRYPGGFWATVACLFVMDEGIHGTKEKAFLRFIAHMLAALLGGAVAIISGYHIVALTIGIAISFFICGYIIGNDSKYSPSGTTCAIAFAIVMLIHSNVDQTLGIIAARVLNTWFGIAVGLITTKYFIPLKLN